MSNFGYNKSKYTANLTVTTPDENTKEGRAAQWDESLGHKLRQVYIDMGNDGVIEILKLRMFFYNFHYLATKEMKRAYFNSDHFKETMNKFKETLINISNFNR